jgi:hypothetical protein
MKHGIVGKAAGPIMHDEAWYCGEGSRTYNA